MLGLKSLRHENPAMATLPTEELDARPGLTDININVKINKLTIADQTKNKNEGRI